MLASIHPQNDIFPPGLALVPHPVQDRAPARAPAAAPVPPLPQAAPGALALLAAPAPAAPQAPQAHLGVGMTTGGVPVQSVFGLLGWLAGEVGCG